MYTLNGWWFLSSSGSYPLVFMAGSRSLTAPTSTSWVTRVLFVPTPTNWEYICTVCAHYSVFCLWPLLQ